MDNKKYFSCYNGPLSKEGKPGTRVSSRLIMRSFGGGEGGGFMCICFELLVPPTLFESGLINKEVYLV